MSEKKKVTNIPEEKLSTAIIRLSEAVISLEKSTGLNRTAIEVLLVDRTHLSKRLVRQVLDGIGDLYNHYCTKEEKRD